MAEVRAAPGLQACFVFFFNWELPTEFVLLWKLVF